MYRKSKMHDVGKDKEQRRTNNNFAVIFGRNLT
jgi:hypothetical protein